MLPLVASFVAGIAVTLLFSHQLFWWQESRMATNALVSNLTDSLMLEREEGQAMLAHHRKTLCSQINYGKKALSAVWISDQESLRQLIEKAEQRANEIDVECDYAS